MAFTELQSKWEKRMIAEKLFTVERNPQIISDIQTYAHWDEVQQLNYLKIWWTKRKTDLLATKSGNTQQNTNIDTEIADGDKI